MSHYYQTNKELKDKIKKLHYTYQGVDIYYLTNSGMFAKNNFDFGSNLLLNNIEIGKEQKILDVGCGYGFLGLAIAKKHKNIEVDMIDINENALEMALYNREYNSISNAKIFISDCFDKVSDYYDMIITNPPIKAGKKIVYEIIFSGLKKLNPQGCLYLVIKKDHGAISLIEKLKLEAIVEVTKKKNGYFVLKASKIDQQG